MKFFSYSKSFKYDLDHEKEGDELEITYEDSALEKEDYYRTNSSNKTSVTLGKRRSTTKQLDQVKEKLLKVIEGSMEEKPMDEDETVCLS